MGGQNKKFLKRKKLLRKIKVWDVEWTRGLYRTRSLYKKYNCYKNSSVFMENIKKLNFFTIFRTSEKQFFEIRRLTETDKIL